MPSFNPPSPQKDMVPRGLLWAMVGLALSALALASWSSLSGRPLAGVPEASQPVSESWFVLEGRSAQSVVVRDRDGTLLLDLPHGGFITVIQNAMARARTVARVPGNPPMKVVRYANGRLVAEDPASGWSAELTAFGSDNKAAFERLLSTDK